MPNLWKVRVECTKECVTHPVIRRFLLEAPDVVAAMKAGEAVAESTAGFEKWVSFKAREAASVQLPLEI